MNYNQNREIVNRVLEKIERQLCDRNVKVMDLFAATMPDALDGKPEDDARGLARVPGFRSGVDATTPTTNRGVEGSQSKFLEWETRRAAVASDGTAFYGGVDGQSEFVFYGSVLPAPLMAALDKFRKQAVENGKPVVVELAGQSGRLSAAPYGRVGYSWAFDCGGLRLLLHRSPCDSIPVCKLVMGFYAVDQLPPQSLVQWTRDFLTRLGVKVTNGHIRRLDIQITAACEITEYASAGVGQRFITFQPRKRVDEEFSRVKSITWGSHDSPVSFKIYDKITELFEVGDPAKLDAVSSRFAGSPDETWLGALTRFEFSLTRDLLKRFGINDFVDYEEKKLALVEYLTFNWLRLTESVPDRENKHQSRARTSSIWERVQEMFRTAFNAPLATFARPKKEVSALLTSQKRERTWQCLAGYYSAILADDVITEGPSEGEKTITSTLLRLAEVYRSALPARFYESMIKKALAKVQEYVDQRRARTLPPELLRAF